MELMHTIQKNRERFLKGEPLSPVTGMVSRVSLEGVLDVSTLRLDGNGSESLPEPDYDLVPSPEGALRVGYDDTLIQKHAQDNLFHLEDETDKENRFYVASLEYPVETLAFGRTKHATKLEFQPVTVIHADCMRSAIDKFEEEYGKRLWLPLSGMENLFERQLGIPRISGDRSVRKAVIHRIRKDCVIGERS